jgi:hypothetical protein
VLRNCSCAFWGDSDTAKLRELCPEGAIRLSLGFQPGNRPKPRRALKKVDARSIGLEKRVKKVTVIRFRRGDVVGASFSIRGFSSLQPRGPTTDTEFGISTQTSGNKSCIMARSWQIGDHPKNPEGSGCIGDNVQNRSLVPSLWK